MAIDLEKFKVSAGLLDKSAGDFKAFMKQRYGRMYKASEYTQLVNKFYGQDKFLEENGKSDNTTEELTEVSE